MQTRNSILLVVIVLVCCSNLIMASENSFKIRGTLPWHNFLSGPTAWNEEDYKAYLDRMKELNLNFIGFHCYTGGSERYVTYVEPMIQIEYRNVLPIAGFDTGITARWGYRSLLLKDYAFETGKLFSANLNYYGADCAMSVKTNRDSYQKAQSLMRHVLEMAHEREIKFAMGFEFGVYPPEFASVAPNGYNIPGTMLPDPTHPSSIELQKITIDDILRAYPGIDYIWLWLHEQTGYVGKAEITGEFKSRYEKHEKFFRDSQNDDVVFTGVWSLEYINQAYDYISKKAPGVKIIIGGWGGGTQLPGVLKGLDQALPKDIIFSCLNPNQGWDPQLDILVEITKNRQVWGVPWLEGDQKLWHLQPRVSLMRNHARLANQQNLDGVVAIHWRTKETRLNLETFAKLSLKPEIVPSVEDIYQKDCERQYGIEAASQLAPILARMDKEQWLNSPDSPEYFPYTPQWGRITRELESRLNDLVVKSQFYYNKTDNTLHKENLTWLLCNIKFTLLLDKVSRRMEAAYRLKDRWFTETKKTGDITIEATQALNELKKAPVEELFNTFKGRNLSPGELGVLSSVNQKLWLQYVELNDFFVNLSAKK